MGKRQYRYKEPPTVPTEWLHTELNLVLKNDQTLHGKILRQVGKLIEFEDSIHRRHRIALSDIAEIIIDKHTDW